MTVVGPQLNGSCCARGGIRSRKCLLTMRPRARLWISNTAAIDVIASNTGASARVTWPGLFWAAFLLGALQHDILFVDCAFHVSTCLRLYTPVRVVGSGAVRPNEPSFVVIGTIARACAANLSHDIVEANPRIAYRIGPQYCSNGIDVCLAVDGSEVPPLRHACIFCILEAE